MRQTKRTRSSSATSDPQVGGIERRPPMHTLSNSVLSRMSSEVAMCPGSSALCALLPITTISPLPCPPTHTLNIRRCRGQHPDARGCSLSVCPRRLGGAQQRRSRRRSSTGSQRPGSRAAGVILYVCVAAVAANAEAAGSCAEMQPHCCCC